MFFSIRMHADRNGQHLSGAERLVGKGQVDQAVGEMVRRASRCNPSTFRISVDEVPSASIVRGPMPDLAEIPVSDAAAGRKRAERTLQEAGVAADVAEKAIETIARGASPEGGNMRGAMLIDAQNGERLEPVRSRGVRVTRMDADPDLVDALAAHLGRHGLIHSRTREALILSAKVLAAPGIVAELCWSDDPEYTAGYVSAPGFGYLRIPRMKDKGDPSGGRAFFLTPGCRIDETVRFLEETPFLVSRLGLIGLSSEKS